MAIDTLQLLTWSRIAAARRAQLTTELFPGGLAELNDYTAEDIKDAAKNFRSHPTVNQRFNVLAISTKRLVQLTLWVKDRVRLGQAVEFDDTTTQPIFVATLEESQQREKIRKERKKNAEELATMKIDPPLKTSTGWDGWKDAIKSALMLAYGSKGVPLLYVIRDDATPTFPAAVGGAAAPTWEETAIEAAPHTGLDYDADRKTVHLFFMNNISEDSDAHAYIHDLIGRTDGRRDWKALCDRYENEATIQARVNQANKTWEVLVYKNERAMSFEAFSTKLTKALQYFEKAGRPKHDGDVIDWIWRHVQSGEMSQHLSALKVGQSIHARTSREILQDIAKEVPNLTKGSSFEPRISGVEHTSGFTFEGGAPDSGVKTTDGKLYCGTYSPSRWFSDSIKPYHEQIKEMREKHGRGKSKPRDRETATRKLQQVTQQYDVLKRKLAALKAEGKEEEKDVTDDKPTDNAGDAFGGQASMKKKKSGD
jgi:hypothetical protein